jgi:transglutaminase-like putative cysteine protease
MGAVAVAPLGLRLAYSVDSEVEDAGSDGAGPAGPRIDAAAEPRFLQLPPLPPRVVALARDLTAGSRDPADAARRLVDFFTREFRYTLSIDRLTALDPLEEFVLVRRTGHCEYFAGSLAAMLRSVGIPARVVNGFQRGEWNPYGRYFIVRRLDAHAWVEAQLDGRGWTTLDPSPRPLAVTEAGGSQTLLLLDSLRLSWHRYVVNWSLRDQLSAARAVRSQMTAWGPWLAALRQGGLEQPLAWLLGAAVLGAAGLYLWRAGPWPGGRSAAGPPAFYARALRILARRGLRPLGSETAREFSRRVGLSRPASAEPFRRLTAAYEHRRFNGARLGPTEQAEIDRCLRRLRGAALDTPGASPQ